MNLRFDDDLFVPAGQDLLGGLLGGLGGGADLPRRHRHAMPGQQLRGLEFMNIHLWKFKVKRIRARLMRRYRMAIGLTIIPTGPV